MKKLNNSARKAKTELDEKIAAPVDGYFHAKVVNESDPEKRREWAALQSMKTYTVEGDVLTFYATVYGQTISYPVNVTELFS